jgi:uncharacterized protein HemX
MRKTGISMGLKGLLAVVLAVVLGWPGILWGQGTQSRGHHMDSPHQADKSYTTERQKKRRQVVRKKVQRFRTQKKGPPQKSGPATQAPPPPGPMHGGPVGPGAQ